MSDLDLTEEWADATRRAFDAMARYKFWMFGYHAARVVFLATLIARAGGPRLPNPFADLVAAARRVYCRACGELHGADHRCTSTSLDRADPLTLDLDEPTLRSPNDGTTIGQ